VGPNLLGATAVTRFILVTFFFLAVAFYEMSGGSGFVAEQRIAVAEPVETVTRADTVTLASLTEVQEPTVPEALTEPLIAPVVATTDATVVDAVVADVVQSSGDPVLAPPVAETVSAADPALDLREVIAELVNVREGPGTDYAVMDKLAQGTQAEVLETDASGWARVRVIDTGLLGWVSAEFLGASNG
jgi:uncharacterized protein YgiM (DUF1202 family)